MRRGDEGNGELTVRNYELHCKRVQVMEERKKGGGPNPEAEIESYLTFSGFGSQLKNAVGYRI